jgi:hypothetical protein
VGAFLGTVLPATPALAIAVSIVVAIGVGVAIDALVRRFSPGG